MKVQENQDEKRDKAAHLAKAHNQQWEKSTCLAQERDAQLQAQKKEEAARLAFADFVESDQEKTSDDDLAQQRTMLLAHKVASETMTQAEILHEQALTEKEYKAARLHEIDRITQAHLEQFQKDQAMLKQIDADEQKVHAQKLQMEAGKRGDRDGTPLLSV